MVTQTASEYGTMTVEKTKNPPRVLLAKIGLDGHDRGVKVLARSFRDAGIEVIYTGLWQTSEATIYAALQEDADVVGVSLLSAAHMTVMPEILRIRKDCGIEDVPVVLGGIVPQTDYDALNEMGIAAVFNPGSPLDEIMATISELAGRSRQPLNKKLIDEGFANRDARMLAKVITAIQRETMPADWTAPKGDAIVLGVTGAPGVGKSSFIGKLGQQLGARGKRVAVVAIDPSSPVTGGALLGDRLRMMVGSPGADFFVRSLSSGGATGGLAPHCSSVVDAMKGFGFDYILVETVGAGQADVSVTELADKTLLLLMPDSGDSVQFSKAGIMEVASGFVLNKCDLAGADASAAQLISAVGDERPNWKVSAVRDEGIEKVADWVTSLTL